MKGRTMVDVFRHRKQDRGPVAMLDRTALAVMYDCAARPGAGEPVRPVRSRDGLGQRGGSRGIELGIDRLAGAAGSPLLEADAERDRSARQERDLDQVHGRGAAETLAAARPMCLVVMVRGVVMMRCLVEGGRRMVVLSGAGCRMNFIEAERRMRVPAHERERDQHHKPFQK